MKRFSICIMAGFFAISSIAYAVITSRPPPPQVFATWDSLEPDKWSSIWLIKHYIDPNAIVEVRPTGDSLHGSIPFGVPQAQYKRTSERSTFESLIVGFNLNDAILSRMGHIINTIETTSWNTPNDPVVHVVEQNFRRLQDKYGRAYVPISCYSHFFDALYTSLSHSEGLDGLNSALNHAVVKQSCAESPDIAERTNANRVREIAIGELLAEITMNKKVVFVDTREAAEYSKSHIPGAVNIPMRDLNHTLYEQLKKADLVISYCVKDFRGYEVARQMLDNGVNNVAVMKPYGLSGWQSVGLPLVSAELSETLAQEHLSACAENQQLCLKSIL